MVEEEEDDHDKDEGIRFMRKRRTKRKSTRRRIRMLLNDLSY